MSDQAFWTLIIFILILIGLIVIYVCARLVIYAVQGKKFLEEVERLHHQAYTEVTVQGRRMARERFEHLIEQAVKSKNPHINNPKMAEDLIGFANFTVKMSVAGGASDAVEAQSWAELVGRTLSSSHNPKPRADLMYKTIPIFY